MVKNRTKPSYETDNDEDRLVPTNFRELALVVLRDYFQKGKFLSESLNDWDRELKIDRTMFRQAQELAFGTIRRSGTLKHLLKKKLSRPLAEVEAELQILLQLGMYQILFMNSVPDHAAVNETVELSKKLRQMSWVKFINGILRNVIRSVSDETASTQGSLTMPLSNGKFLKFKTEMFSDPETNPIQYFSEAYSFPHWLSKRWEEQYSPHEMFELGDWFNSVHPLTLRTNHLKTSREELMQNFIEKDLKVSQGEEKEAIVLESGGYVQGLPGFHDGLFTVQNETAIKASHLLNPVAGENVLDLCAAPGTKTGHLAELMKNEGSVIACDVSTYRLNQIQENIDRSEYTIIQTELIEKDGSDIPSGPFDAIIIDAPCSNTGVMGKRPEARWRIDETDITELVEIQKRLLMQASERLNSGGRIVYSTCSMEPEENQKIIAWFLGQCTDLSLQHEQIYLPGKPADGGYQALFVKK